MLDVAYGGAQRGAKSTGDVAAILEGKYAIFETFFSRREDKIAGWISEAVEDALDLVVNGQKPSDDMWAGAMQKIEAEFRTFLDAGEMNHIVQNELSEAERAYFLDSTGGFNGAAKRGVNHRLKKPTAKANAARMAFVDTGLFQQSARAWIIRATGG